MKSTKEGDSTTEGETMAIRQVGRIMLTLSFMIMTGMVLSQSHAADLSVVEVRRNIQMSEQDAVYRDYYINAGSNAGLKKNMIVQVKRKQSLKDSTGTKNLGEIEIPVGELKILYVENQMAVAREARLLSREEYPVLEQTAIMIGDRIDIQAK